MGFFEKLASGLKKTRESFTEKIDSVFSVFSGADEEFYEELEEILILADVGGETSSAIVESLREKVKERKLKDASEIREALKEIIQEILGDENEVVLDGSPAMIILTGVNGVGKTTSCAKIAKLYKDQGKKVILGAADTFRAAAADQLMIWAERVGVDIIRQGEGADPASVVFDTIAAAKARKADIIICDTAGRLHNKKNLMDELNKVFRVAKRELPGTKIESLLVLDATTGQNALMQAKEFQKVVELTGIVLTKLDGTAKGGMVIAVKNELEIPVKFIGVGEKENDLQIFERQEFVDALFDENNA